MFHVTAELWGLVLFDMVNPALTYSSLEKAEIIRPLYFGRFLTFFKEALDLDHESSQELIKGQAKLFYEQREEYIG